ncbi:MAG: TonB-dependent receptor [Pseudomonadota bacterium]
MKPFLKSGTSDRALGLAITGAALLLPAYGQASAQQVGQPSDTIEEIVVTAQKRNENMQSTPIAISAFTGDSIAKKGLADIQQVARLAPNVSFDFTAPVSGASNAATVFIRGIGQQDFALTTDAGVGTYVDGVYVSRSVGGVLDVLDIERMEILRGPQGTLFGRNTIGGAISIISKMPDKDFGGSLEASLGNYGRRYLRGTVSLPLGPVTGLRISLSSKDKNGFVKSAYTPQQKSLLNGNALTDLGNENRQAARALLTHEFSDRFTATLSGDYSRLRENNAGDRLAGITSTLADGPLVFAYNTFGSTPSVIPVIGNDRYTMANYYTGTDTTYSTGPNGSSIDAWGTALTLDYKVSEALSLKSVTAYRKTTGSFNRDADGSPLVITETSNYGYRHQQFTQELQAVGDLADGAIKYAAGLFYFDEKGSDPLIVRLPEVVGTIYQDVADVRNKSYAAYAQATWTIVEDLSLTGGGRYTKDKKRFLSDQYIVTGSASPFLFGGAPAGTLIPLVPRNSVASQSFEKFSPRLSLDYRFDRNVLVYGSYSKGFKSGGFNLRYVAPRPSILSFAPENATTFEVGTKIDAFDRKVRLNLAAFTTDYKGIQVTVFENLGAPVTLNAGDARIKGFEAEFTAIPLSGLELNANLGYLDSRYTDIRANPALVSTPEQILSLSTRLPKSPKWQGTLSGSYTYTLESDAKLDARADFHFSSSYANDALNSRFLNQGSYQTLGMSAGYTAPGRQWSLRLFVDNVTNERYIASGDSNYGIGFHEANYNRPREWGATMGFTF